ncbi:MAG: hypothetical protein ACP5NC_08600, partial [Nitrososphaeria archaeon]
SLFFKLLTHGSHKHTMKLTDDKIRWIIRRKVDGSLTTAQIAELQGVDQSRVRQLWREFRNTGKVPP